MCLLEVREVQPQDISQLLALYTHLHGEAAPAIDDEINAIWRNILQDPNHHVIVGAEGDAIVSSCVVVIVPNLTHGQRPYALVENVITHPAHRGKGHATQMLRCAKEIAASNHCYKIMLMTGAKTEATLNFYKRAGYNAKDKTAFIQWLK